jgi:hypothetical protein
MASPQQLPNEKDYHHSHHFVLECFLIFVGLVFGILIAAVVIMGNCDSQNQIHNWLTGTVYTCQRDYTKHEKDTHEHKPESRSP